MTFQGALSIVTIDFGKDGMQELKETQLPGDWKSFPAPASTKKLRYAVTESGEDSDYKNAFYHHSE
ncbi:MAG: hypothetical protein WDM78_15730 [Puia sp.]